MKVARFILRVIPPFRLYLIGLVFVMIIFAIDLSLRPYLTKLIVNAAINKTGEGAIVIMKNIALIYIIMQFVMPVMWRFYDWCLLKYEPALKHYISTSIVSHLSDQSHNFFQHNFTGNLLNKINDASQYVPHLINTIISSFIFKITNFFFRFKYLFFARNKLK